MVGRKIIGASAPLFDRLQICEDKEASSRLNLFGILTFEELKRSIINELALMLNTRCVLRKELYEDLEEEGKRELKVPELYGLRDFSFFDPASQKNWPSIAQAIENKIRIFEPRLENPLVTVEEFDRYHQSLSVDIQGTIIINQISERVFFPMSISL